MKLREVKFNDLRRNGFIGLSVFKDGNLVAEGSIGEVLKNIPHLADDEIKMQNPYFNEWVIRI